MAIFSVLSLITCAAAAQPSTRTRVAILMFDGVEIIDFAGPYEVFGQAGFDVYTVSEDGEPVTTAMNLRVDVDHDFASAPEADIVLVPGGHVHDAMKDPETLEFVRTRAEPADQVLSVCTGSFILAETGLLDGLAATTFHRQLDVMAKDFPAIEIVRDRRWVDTGKLVTSAGLSSGIDAALHVVAEVQGIDAARTVALRLEYDWSPGDREGFIRGLLADMHARYPAGMAFPEGTQIHPLVSLGDDRRWETKLHVLSPLAPAAFMAHLRGLAEADEALSIVETNVADSVSWRHTDDAGRWEQHFTVTSTDGNGGFEILGEVTILE